MAYTYLMYLHCTFSALNLTLLSCYIQDVSVQMCQGPRMKQVGIFYCHCCIVIIKSAWMVHAMHDAFLKKDI